MAYDCRKELMAPNGPSYELVKGNFLTHVSAMKALNVVFRVDLEISGLLCQKKLESVLEPSYKFKFQNEAQK